MRLILLINSEHQTQHTLPGETLPDGLCLLHSGISLAEQMAEHLAGQPLPICIEKMVSKTEKIQQAGGLG